MEKKDSKQRLFEVMSRLDKTFKPNLNEWNFDKKKEDDEDKEKVEGEETTKHEESETPEEEKEEKKELDEVKPKVPVNMIAKVGGK